MHEGKAEAEDYESEAASRAEELKALATPASDPGGHWWCRKQTCGLDQSPSGSTHASHRAPTQLRFEVVCIVQDLVNKETQRHCAAFSPELLPPFASSRMTPFRKSKRAWFRTRPHGMNPRVRMNILNECIATKSGEDKREEGKQVG